MKKTHRFGKFSRFLRAHHEHEEHEENCTALCCARSGQSADILYFAGDDAREAAMLRDLGVREGARVTVVRDGDPLVVKVDNARFGIGRSAATKVICQLVEDGSHSCKLRSTH